MEINRFKLFFVILVCESLLETLIKANKHEIRLLDSILKNYDKRSRPVEDYNSPLNITFSISLLQIFQVDEKHQTITTKLRRIMAWNDYSFKWNPENYGNISMVTIPRDQIWSPDIQLYNLAAYEQQIENNIKTILMNDGAVIDVVPMVVQTTCKMDVTWFPFDEQQCELTYGSWTLSTKYLYLEIDGISADASTFIDDGQWKLMKVPGVGIAYTYPCCPNETYSNIIFTMHLKRKSLYYFFNLLVPCGLIGFLAVLGFTLPPESGEKLSLGVTVLFSLIVFLNMIGESMPANSDAVPLLGTFFNCVMFMIALSVVSTIVINLKLRGVYTTTLIEGRSKKVFMYWLPRILRMSPRKNLVFTQRDRVSSSTKKVTALDTNLLGQTQEEIVNQQWKFVASVVERLCLIISLIFTFISVIVFLIYAF